MWKQKTVLNEPAGSSTTPQPAKRRKLTKERLVESLKKTALVLGKRWSP